jgi:hypothetical protein
MATKYKVIETNQCCHCEREKEDHCDFKPKKVKIPEACVCEAEEWDQYWISPYKIPKVCSRFIAEQGDEEFCITCSHLKGCHKNDSA